jgi:hypothetical protein
VAQVTIAQLDLLQLSADNLLSDDPRLVGIYKPSVRHPAKQQLRSLRHPAEAPLLRRVWTL